jgi:hypothetical protein
MIFGTSLIVAQLPDPMHTQASMDELLSYECAKSVATMLYPEDQAGPVFSVSDLVFTSIEASDNSRMLIVSAGDGLYSIPLERDGVNRLRFSIPAHGAVKPKEFYLGFLHDSVTRSRFFDFSADRPPLGKEEIDYAYVVPRRADQLLPNLEYNIHETAEGMLLSLTEGRLERSQIISQKAHNCEHITRKAPALGRNLKRNLDVVEKIVIGPKSKPARAIAARAAVPSRAPASLAANPKP